MDGQRSLTQPLRLRYGPGMRSWTIALPGVLLVAGCMSLHDVRHQAPGRVVATYAGRTLTTGEILAQMQQLSPPARTFLTTPENKRGFVENLVLDELLYEEGAALGYTADPAITSRPEQFRRPLVVVKVLARYRTAQPVNDAEVRRYYDAHKAAYAQHGKVPRFDRVREPLRSSLTKERSEDQVREHLESLKRQANLRIVDDELAGLDPLAGLSPRPAPAAATGH